MYEGITILLVEDDQDDILLTKEAFEENKFHLKLEIVCDGEEALDYLYQRKNYENVKLPDLVLLDLNLPKINGFEVLETMKNDSKLAVIPVVILTTSSSESDITQCYQSHANSYVTKPVGFQKFSNLLKAVENFWFTVVKLPNRENEN